MATKIRVIGDTAVNWERSNPVLATDEVGVETDTGFHKVGNGVNPWQDLIYGGGPKDLTTIIAELQEDRVDLTTDQTIDGVKTFTSSPIIPTPTTDFEAATRKFAEEQAAHTHYAGLLDVDAFGPTDSGDLYPTGWSAFPVSNTAGWPHSTWGFVINEKHGGGRFVQHFHGSLGGLPQVSRSWHSDVGWQSWEYEWSRTEARAVSGDWNDVTASGIYRGSGLANSSPYGSHTWQYVMVIRHSPTYALQVSWNYNGGATTGGGGAAYRVMYNGTWQAWQPLDAGQDTSWRYIGASGQPAFENGWINYSSSWVSARFRKDANGFVHVEGFVDPTAATTAQMFTLPTGYRPSHHKRTPGGYRGDHTVLQATMLSTGAFTMNGFGAGVWIGFDMTFLAEQ